MAHSQFNLFLQEATIRGRDAGSTLAAAPLYGLYTSWCHVPGTRPGPRAPSGPR
ncbi:hypothetical protein [Arthrobacter sp. ZGTC131]|uniref:hypothetical protein n=1 Tax=Arthrobacter sp. ZGTC131 TaxID=2058898 RepID=UPI00215799B8|nr:hypothetical protein [Arthrobacter sp. ZGTC131]